MSPLWIPMFLEAIKHDFETPLPPHKDTSASTSVEDLQWINQNAEDDDPFDTLRLKKQMIDAVQTNKAFLQTRVCALGTILVLTFEPIEERIWTFWWHCIRLICPGKHVRVVFYLHPKGRDLPPKGTAIESQHINGGLTMRCDAKTVVVYRKEEATRVLIHELFHANCSDPYEKDTQFLEADTEAWAEIFLCAALAKGNKKEFEKLLHEQFLYALEQTEYLQKNHNVESPQQYAWRYTVGRLEVWKRLGFTMPHGTKRSVPKSLRLTKESLEP